MEGLHPQRVIVYDSSKGKGLVYHTVYTEEELRRGIIRCVRDKPLGANVRAVLAKEHASL